MSDPRDWWRAELQRAESLGLRRLRRELTSLPGGRCQLDGRDLWDFSSNDYLGLAHDERVIAAAREALQAAGAGARASALVSGRSTWHVRLEQALKGLKQADDCLLFPSGYAANAGLVAAVAGPEDAIFSDRLNHASLIDGARLARSRFRVYPHLDVSRLRQLLAAAREFRRRVILTDSLFSMDGDAAPLAELVQLAEDEDALLVVDEAHATGVCGEGGGGLLEEIAPAHPRVIAIGTLSKALGSQGGFVTGDNELIEWLWNSARTQMFSTALAPAACGAAAMAVQIVQTEPERRVRLRRAAQHVAATLRGQGWRVPDRLAGPILPVLIGDAAATVQLADQLRQRGVLVAAIRPPTVPPQQSRLRISLSSAHGERGVDALLEAFRELANLHSPSLARIQL